MIDETYGVGTIIVVMNYFVFVLFLKNYVIVFSWM